MTGLEGILFEVSAVFFGAAALASLFLFAKQPIILAYIALGAALGPFGFRVIENPEHIRQMSRVGVVLLLFIAGLDLQPMKFLGLIKESAALTLATAASFFLISGLFALGIGLSPKDAIVFGTAMMFSSTVVGLKLVPTTTLHQRRAGELMTSVLLLQDVVAILAILLVLRTGNGNFAVLTAVVILKFALFAAAAAVSVRALVFPLLRRFDTIQEYTMVLALGWCLFCSQAAHALGLSLELGAFVAGIALASQKVSLVISVHLKPLREFFLILFFFAVGAGLDFLAEPKLLAAGVLFGAALVAVKAAVFRRAFERIGEARPLAAQLGARLGQASEFSFLIALAAVSAGALTRRGELLIQTATIASFIASTYWVVTKYPTPISSDEALLKD